MKLKHYNQLSESGQWREGVREGRKGRKKEEGKEDFYVILHRFLHKVKQTLSGQ